MAVNRVNELKFKKYSKKRNQLLFLLIFPTIIIFVSMYLVYISKIVLTDTLITIFLPVLIIDFISIVLIQPKLSLYSMYYDYSLLMIEDHVPKKTSKKLFTTSWINNFQKLGFKVAQDYQSYILMYQYYKKLEGVNNSDEVLVFITIAKNKDTDFYSEEIDHAIQSVYLSDKKYQKINKQITIQYKKFDSLDETVKEEVESAILFKSGKQRVINFTVAYLDDVQSIYCICPEKRYPNKYVYYACQEIKRLSHIKE